MGICPQHDVVSDKLTVREHLQLYASLKGVHPDEIEGRVCITYSPYAASSERVLEGEGERERAGEGEREKGKWREIERGNGWR